VVSALAELIWPALVITTGTVCGTDISPTTVAPVTGKMIGAALDEVAAMQRDANTTVLMNVAMRGRRTRVRVKDAEKDWQGIFRPKCCRSGWGVVETVMQLHEFISRR
jgi:hypothetical protein